MKLLSDLVMPLMIGIILVFGLVRGVRVFDAFLKGATDGLQSAVKILPSLVGLVSAVTMLRASGAMERLCHGVSFITTRLGFPAEVLPFALLRPISGGASTALLNDLLTACGPDTFAGRVASVIAGSTETTFYTMTIYFAAVHARDTRHTLGAALLADAAGILLGVAVVRLLL